jgi:transglycosylase-like protein
VKKMIAAMLVVAALIPAVALAADAATGTADTRNVGRDKALAMRALQHRAKVRKQRAEARRKQRAKARRKARARKRAAAAASTASPTMQAIAACESGGDPHALGGGGTYRGKYQFDQSTWASVGGTGDPAAAPEAEQDKRAAMLYARVGRSAWPVCGQ